MPTPVSLTRSDIEKALTPVQFQAVQHVTGPLAIVAGPGSGKTRVLTYRGAYLVAVKQIDPRSVFLCTFTNRATREMVTRLSTLLPASAAARIWVKTFHATGAALLRKYGEHLGIPGDFSIYDDQDSMSVLKRIYVDLEIDPERLLIDRVSVAIEHAKRNLLTPLEFRNLAQSDDEKETGRVYAAYQAQLEATHALDFGDLVTKTVRLLEEHDRLRERLQDRFRYLMVDEFQDTDLSQKRLVEALTGSERNVCVVGDDDQSVYSWRGGDARNLSRFREKHPDATVIHLVENHRSTKHIVRASRSLIERCEAREQKRLHTNNGKGARLEILHFGSDRGEARIVASRFAELHKGAIPFREMAIMYRKHSLSRPFEDELRSRKIPYVVVGGLSFYRRREVKDVIAYLRLLERPDDASVIRVINVPGRGIGATTIQRLVGHARSTGLSLWRVLRNGDLPRDLLGRPRASVLAFVDLVRRLRRKARKWDGQLSRICKHVLDVTHYRKMHDDGTPEGFERLANIEQLVAGLATFEQERQAPTLRMYLDEVALADATARDVRDKDYVTLSTAHAAKGCEYDTVVIAAVESGIMPMSQRDDCVSQLMAPTTDPDEERRLAYVAMTRARRNLIMTHSDCRTTYGGTQRSFPSAFLNELPEGSVIRTDLVRETTLTSGRFPVGGSARRQ